MSPGSGMTSTLSSLLTGSIGAAVVTGVFGLILTVISWIRGVRPDARAELQLALEQQRATIDRLTASNDQQQKIIDQERARGMVDQRTLESLQVEVTRTSIYLVRLEAYCDDLESKLTSQGVVLGPRPTRPPTPVMEDTIP